VICEQDEMTFEVTNASFRAATCQGYERVQWWLWNRGIMTSFHEEGLWPLDEKDVSFSLTIKSETLDPLDWIRWINPTLWIERMHLLVPRGNRCKVAYK
jgi:hypothetical protein